MTRAALPLRWGRDGLPAAPRRSLLVQLSAMGDQVQTLPAVSDIAARWPGAEIDWAVDARFADIARQHPAVRRVFALPLKGVQQAPRELARWRALLGELRALRVTKSARTPYDHMMLQLLDMAKADLDYQRKVPQAAVDFAPGSTWVVFSDQVSHAVMRGQHMMDQTFYLDPADQLVPDTSPLHVLERVLGRTLLRRGA